MVIYHGTFTVKEGKREAYIKEILASGLLDDFRKQKGNCFYDVSPSVDNENELIICDCWEDENAFKGHVDSKEVVRWHEMYNNYVVHNIPLEYHF
ncbi:MAG: antibiotic biosynthesis monooxygenase [Lachnospiraceae bacterium]|nr:antibiotic biosynthesis monooxygenase [Lachnospiraceae bacterium]